MCTAYSAPGPKVLVQHFSALPKKEWRTEMSPLYPGPFLKAEAQGPRLEVGQWGMIPPRSQTSVPTNAEGRRMSTFNARREGIAKSWTFGGPWRRGQRCIIPAQTYIEPYWEDKVHTAWQFARADGEPFGLAGLWSEWTDPVTGEVVPNYTMVTQNCDEHPLLRLFHRPDPKRPPDKQDKRTVVPLEKGDWDAWLHGTVEQAEALIRLPPVELFVHGPQDPTKQVQLPLPGAEMTPRQSSLW